jgi:V8-like Glu-specific endopeptidase
MTRTIQRSAIILAAVGLIAGLSPVAASGRTDAKAAPKVAALSRPSVIDPELRGRHISRGFAGSFGPTNQQYNDGSAGVPVGMPAGTESVILPDGRVQVTDTESYPASAIGQIELTFGPEDPQPGAYICTGWLIDSNTILSSGHCAYEPSPSGTAIVNTATFSPGRNGDVDAFGSCNVVQVYSPEGWRVNGKFTADWSLMQLDCAIGDTVGYLGYFWKADADALKGLDVRVDGYPGDKPDGTQWKMNGTISASDKNMAYYKIDTAGGQSGSPVFVPNKGTCGPCAAAIHSYGVGLPGPGLTRNAGPRFTKSKFLLIQDLADNNNPPA